jgi:hypothetical protein
MYRIARVTIAAGFAAALMLALSPLAAQAKNSGSSHSSTSHSSGNKTTSGKPNNTMHMAPYTKVSHDSSKPQHDYKHKDSQTTHTDHQDKNHYCKDKDHFCKDHCHDHCHDFCWPYGFYWDYACFGGFEGSCDLGYGGCDGNSPVIIKTDDIPSDGDETVVIDQ